MIWSYGNLQVLSSLQGTGVAIAYTSSLTWMTTTVSPCKEIQCLEYMIKGILVPRLLFKKNKFINTCGCASHHVRDADLLICNPIKSIMTHGFY